MAAVRARGWGGGENIRDERKRWGLLFVMDKERRQVVR